MPRRCLDDVEVAAKLGRDREWFRRNKRKLIEEQGFPRPLPILRRWDEAAINAWLDRYMPRDQEAEVVLTVNPIPDELKDDEEDLIARAAGIAADQARTH